MLKNATLIQKALSLVIDSTPAIGALAATFQSGQYRKGDVIQAYTFEKPTVQTLGAPAESLQATTRPVTLDKFKQVAFKVPYQDINETPVNLVRAASEELAKSIGDIIVDAALSVVTPANFPDEIQIAKEDIDRMLLIESRQKLVANKASSARYGVANPIVYGQFQADPVLGMANRNPLGGEVVRDGVIRQASGFDIYERPELTPGLDAFFAGREAILFASGAPVDPSDGGSICSGGNFELFTDEKSGISVMGQEYVDGTTLETMVRLIFLYGVAVGRPESGVRVVLDNS